MLTSSRKFTLQEEGYAARKEGAACPYEHRSDEWHQWRTGWLMRRYEEEVPPSRPLHSREGETLYFPHEMC